MDCETCSSRENQDEPQDAGTNWPKLWDKSENVEECFENTIKKQPRREESKLLHVTSTRIRSIK